MMHVSHDPDRGSQFHSLSVCSQVYLEDAQEEELITVDAVGCFEGEEEDEEEKEEVEEVEVADEEEGVADKEEGAEDRVLEVQPVVHVCR